MSFLELLTVASANPAPVLAHSQAHQSHHSDYHQQCLRPLAQMGLVVGVELPEFPVQLVEPQALEQAVLALVVSGIVELVVARPQLAVLMDLGLQVALVFSFFDVFAFSFLI
jgi:hypothetical protein